MDYAQVRQHILDLSPVKKACAADDPIRNTVALHGVFQSVRLGVGPVKEIAMPLGFMNTMASAWTALPRKLLLRLLR